MPKLLVIADINTKHKDICALQRHIFYVTVDTKVTSSSTYVQ